MFPSNLDLLERGIARVADLKIQAAIKANRLLPLTGRGRALPWPMSARISARWMRDWAARRHPSMSAPKPRTHPPAPVYRGHRTLTSVLFGVTDQALHHR